MTRVYIGDLVADLRGIINFKANVDKNQTGVREGAAVYLRFLKERYLNAGNGTWPSLEESTRKRKARIGANPNILFEFGDLFANLVMWQEGNRWIVGYKEDVPHTSYATYSFAGTVAQLARIQSTGAYRNGKRRPIIVVPDAETFEAMRRAVGRGLNIEIQNANRTTSGR